MTNLMTRRLFLDGTVAIVIGLLSRPLNFDAVKDAHITEPQVNLLSGEVIRLNQSTV